MTGLKYYRDMKNSLDTAFEEGREEGKEVRDIEIVLQMHSKGKAVEEISELTGLSVVKVKEIIKRNEC